MLRIVPWSSRDEWLDTYKELYNFDNTELQIKGMKRVETWKSRSGNKLPLSIESTVSLIAAGVEDVQSKVSKYVVRQTMAMVIVRFVNGMVDMEQKGAYARSVQSIADEIGLPDWLVDLRHEATHASLPSLEVLRAGCRFALNWLQDRYWESQIAEFRERDESLVTLLGTYAELCANVWSHKKTVKNVKYKEIAEKIAELVAKYNMWELLLDISFGDNGSLVPSPEILQEMFAETTDQIKTMDVPLELPKDLHKSLAPLLKALHKINDNFLSNLVFFLINKVHKHEQNSENELLVHFYCCCVYFILFNCREKTSEKKQWSIKAELDYLALLETCLKKPSTYSPQLLPIIIENLEISSDNLKVKLNKFSTIKVAFNKGKNLKKAIHYESTVLEQLEKQFPLVAKHAQARCNELEDESGSIWQECPSSFAKSFKFGCALGEDPQQIDDKNQTNEERIEEEPSLEGNAARDDNMQEMINLELQDSDASVISLENDLNEEEFLCPSDAKDALAPKDLTDEMTKDISDKIWIF